MNNVYSAAGSAEREERDLATQRKVALWTAIMGAMAVIGIALSGVGIYLIWQTWSESKAAAQAGIKANEIAQNVQRPWVNIHVVPKMLKKHGDV